MIVRRRPGLPRELGAERFADEAGLTLIEMLVVIVILGIVLAGMTQLFVAASTSQSDQTKRVAAQQEGRLALDKLRRELHCASVITLTSASSLTATLGSYCPTVPSTTLSSAVTLPAATIAVASTSKFNSAGNTLSFGSSGTVTCSGKTSTSFTGCSGGTAGTYASGTKVISPVTWCVTGSSAPFTLKRYVGPTCSGSSGRSWAGSLTSSSIFAQGLVSAPTLTAASTGGTLAASGATYAYEVAAVTSSGEIVGTVAHVTPSGTTTTNKVTLSWSAYTGATSYNVYGRDDFSSGMRLLRNTTSTSYVDIGPTSLSSSLTVPTSGTYTVPVVSTTGYGATANTISFGGSGTVSCTGTTSTTFTGCSGGIPGGYASGTVVNNISIQRPPLASLSVSLVLDQTPADSAQRFTLNDVIDFRNSRPF